MFKPREIFHVRHLPFLQVFGPRWFMPFRASITDNGKVFCCDFNTNHVALSFLLMTFSAHFLKTNISSFKMAITLPCLHTRPPNGQWVGLKFGRKLSQFRNLFTWLAPVGSTTSTPLIRLFGHLITSILACHWWSRMFLNLWTRVTWLPRKLA